MIFWSALSILVQHVHEISRKAPIPAVLKYMYYITMLVKNITHCPSYKVPFVTEAMLNKTL